MSYCRWSDMDFKCDLYAYEGSDGYVIHVASTRIVPDLPKLPDLSSTPMAIFWNAYRKQLAARDQLTDEDRVAIDLEYAGDTFVEPDLESFEERLRELRELGYHFPDWVFDTIEEEKKEEEEDA